MKKRIKNAKKGFLPETGFRHPLAVEPAIIEGEVELVAGVAVPRARLQQIYNINNNMI